MSKFSPLIAAEEVRILLSQSDVIIVDARGGADALQRHERAHVTGAVFFDLETDLSAKRPDPADGGRHPLPEPEAFSRLLGSAGIDPATHIVVYDDKAGANAAARFWWMMKSAGHNKVQVVNGGLKALDKAGVPISTGRSAFRRERSPYPLQNWKLPLADMDTVVEARGQNTWLIIDVRENYRYRGESEPIDLVAGHIPGAVNFPYLDNLQADDRFKSPEALADAYKKVLGSCDESKIIVHCGSGVTACHSILAMASAGMSPPMLYVGSWSEWSRNNKPIATSDKA